VKDVSSSSYPNNFNIFVIYLMKNVRNGGLWLRNLVELMADRHLIHIDAGLLRRRVPRSCIHYIRSTSILLNIHRYYIFSPKHSMARCAL